MKPLAELKPKKLSAVNWVEHKIIITEASAKRPMPLLFDQKII